MFRKGRTIVPNRVTRGVVAVFVLLLSRAMVSVAAEGDGRAAPDGGPRRPNVLLCVADDWGWPHAGAYGDKVARTPAFDRLAREGVLFVHAFVSAPSCTPSRNAMLTGQQFYRLDQGANLQATLDVKHPTFVRLLENAGYQTGHWRKAWGPGVFEAGGYERHPCGEPVSFEQFMKRRDPAKPFCFWFGTSDPHRPYGTGSGRKAGIEVTGEQVPPFLPDHEITRGDLADYYLEVQRWDADVAKALALLEAAGELENTIVVMTGDNGMPFPRCKGNLYDWGSRAPLAIRWGAGVKGVGRQVAEFVSLTDLAPTFLAAAGVDAPSVMTGRSLLPFLQGEEPARKEAAAESRTFVVTGRERHAAAQEMPSLAGYPSRAIRTSRYLYVLNLEPGRWPAGVPENATHPIGRHADCDDGPTKALILERRDDPQYRRFYDLCFAPRPAAELYDVAADPHQVRNLAADPAHADAVRQLHEQLTAYLRETGDPRFTDQPVRFDEYPYRDERIHRRIREWQAKHSKER